MKTDWDYSTLADAYLKRPDYADAAVDGMLAIAGVQREDSVCDVGAGVAHLTIMLAARGFNVVAVEPNDAMRSKGIARTSSISNIQWHEGTGEETGQESGRFNLVTFGSSFNVCDRAKALDEVARISKPKGWFACMWNHRDLSDPIQAEIEQRIKSIVDGYQYGTRREDQAPVINESGLFGPVIHLDATVIHEQSVQECVEAWRSHATLERQAGDRFAQVVASIEEYLKGLGGSTIQIPYSTHVWLAQLR